MNSSYTNSGTKRKAQRVKILTKHGHTHKGYIPAKLKTDSDSLLELTTMLLQLIFTRHSSFESVLLPSLHRLSWYFSINPVPARKFSPVCQTVKHFFCGKPTPSTAAFGWALRLFQLSLPNIVKPHQSQTLLMSPPWNISNTNYICFRPPNRKRSFSLFKGLFDI